LRVDARGRNKRLMRGCIPRWDSIDTFGAEGRVREKHCRGISKLWRIDCLGALALPEDDQNIIVTVHYYRPLDSAHQGVPCGDTRRPKGVEWLGTDEALATISGDLKRGARWAAEHNRPIYLSEFGVYDAADMASRARWTSAAARQAEALGWRWSYW